MPKPGNLSDKLNEINPKDPFVDIQKKCIMQFNKDLVKINKDCNINKADTTLLNRLVQIYKNIVFELNKLSTENFDDEMYITDPLNPEINAKTDPSKIYKYTIHNLEIPTNPNNGGFQPAVGNYNGKINLTNRSAIQDIYKLYYSSDGYEGILDCLADLFNKVIGCTRNKIFDYFNCKTINLINKINKSKLENIDLNEIIDLWREVALYLEQLRDNALLQDNTIIRQVYSYDEFEKLPETSINNYEKYENYDKDENSGDYIIFKFLTQPFFNSEPGGSHNNGQLLQCLITAEYKKIKECILYKIYELICDKIIKDITCKLDTLIPCDVLEDTTENNCGNESCNLQPISICNIYGTRNNIQKLLNIINNLQQIIKERYSIEETFQYKNSYDVKNEIEKKFDNYEIISTTQILNEHKVVIFIRDSEYIDSDILCLYIQLDDKINFINEFLSKMDEIKDGLDDNVNIKDETTETIKEKVRETLHKFTESANKDIKINVDSTNVDYNLLTTYANYINKIHFLRNKIKKDLMDLESELECIDELHDQMNDVLYSTEYYKMCFAGRWIITDTNKKRKNKWLSNNS